MRAKLISILGVFLAVLCCICGCQSKGQPTAASLYPNELVRDAWKTHAAYIKAINAGIEKPGTDIPSVYWAKRIKALQPLYVYTHMANIVVVQHVADGTEQGKYIWIPISSFLPQSGDDGFQFTPNPRSGDTYDLGSGVFDFKRTRTK